MTADLLVCIDLQQVFDVDSAGPWATPGFPDAVRGAAPLVDAFGDRVVFTRFLPPARPSGSWIDYYTKWDFATDPAASFWKLVDPWSERPTLDFPTLSKWDPRLAALVGAGELVLTGVTTDCCVMATALAAADAGTRVRVIADACGAENQRVQAMSVELLSRRAPLITVTSVDQELRRRN